MRDVQSPLKIDHAAKYTQNGKIRIYAQKHANGRTELIGVEIKGTQIDQTYFHLFFDR
jgi:hypothetical protein